MRELIEFLIIILLLITLVIAFVLSVGIHVEHKSCNDYSSVTGRTVEYKLYGGCFVETKDGWFSYKELKKEIK